jgi:hypothetical protein
MSDKQEILSAGVACGEISALADLGKVEKAITTLEARDAAIRADEAAKCQKTARISYIKAYCKACPCSNDKLCAGEDDDDFTCAYLADFLAALDAVKGE